MIFLKASCEIEWIKWSWKWTWY